MGGTIGEEGRAAAGEEGREEYGTGGRGEGARLTGNRPDGTCGMAIR